MGQHGARRRRKTSVVPEHALKAIGRAGFGPGKEFTAGVERRRAAVLAAFLKRQHGLRLDGDECY